MINISWTPCVVTLGELVPWERNPKRISKANAKRLLDFWQRIGQFQTVAVGPALEVYDGHQRLSVLKAAFGVKYPVQALRASRALTEGEREELVIQAHTGTVGTWDFDALAAWDVTALQNWGLDAATLDAWNDQAANLREMLAAEVHAFGDTSTNRDGQGVASTWNIMRETNSHKVLIGDIESRLSDAVFETLRKCLQYSYETNGTPYSEMLANVIVAGVRFVEGGNS